jgi:dolichyl-diphosphooligosaccharide--protein glycosyltransferase
VFPVIQESDYLNNGEYRVDKEAAPKMLQCLMYVTKFYRELSSLYTLTH